MMKLNVFKQLFIIPFFFFKESLVIFLLGSYVWVHLINVTVIFVQNLILQYSLLVFSDNGGSAKVEYLHTSLYT